MCQTQKIAPTCQQAKKYIVNIYIFVPEYSIFIQILHQTIFSELSIQHNIALIEVNEGKVNFFPWKILNSLSS